MTQETTNTIKQSLQIIQTLHSIGNTLNVQINEMISSIDWYNCYNCEKFILGNIENDKDGILIKNQIQKAETTIDKTYECLRRNDCIYHSIEMLENLIETFQTNLNELKSEILSDRERFILSNNDILKILERLETKLTKREIKKLKQSTNDNNQNEINELKKIHEIKMNQNKQIQRKTIEEEQKRIEQNKRSEHFKDVLTNEQLKYIEEWTNLPILDIVYNSREESWDIIGNEGSHFQENIISKNNLFFYIETEEGDKFGLYVKERINQYGKAIEDNNSFLCSLKSNNFEKYDIIGSKTITIHNKQKFDLFEIGDESIIIKKGRGKKYSIAKQQSIQKDCLNINKNFLTNRKETFDPKTIVVFQMEETDNMMKKMKNEMETKLEIEKVELEEKTKKLFSKPSNKIQKIEKIFERKAIEVLFDSFVNDWKRYSSNFQTLLMNKKELLILIQTTNNEIYSVYENNLVMINENEEITKHEISMKDRNDSLITIFNSSKDGLMKIGKDDILLFKENQKDKCYLIQNQEKIHFVPQRIQIYETCETGVFDQKKEEKKNEINSDNRNNQVILNETVLNNQKEKTIDNTKRKRRRERDKVRLKEIEEDQLIDLNDITNKLQMDQPLEIQYIEQMTSLKFKEVIFDSDYCNWESGSTCFDERIFGKDKLMFLIKTQYNETIGGFIYETIDRLDSFISDSKAFLFNLNDDKMNKYQIISSDCSQSFKVYSHNERELFSFGETDLCIMKEDKKIYSSSNQNVYNMIGEKNILMNEDSDGNTFVPKRIQVIQFSETDLQKQQYEQRLLQRMKNEEKMMRNKSEEIKRKQTKMKRMIQQWTEMTFDKIIFDTTCCNWSIDESTFDKHIIGKEHLIFIIEDENENIFGGYIHESITKYKQIFDSKSFLFSIKLNGSMKNPIKYSITPEYAYTSFELSQRSGIGLFTFGNNDICIMKKNYESDCQCQQSAYNYEGKDNVFIGKQNYFTLKKLQVWQMIETEEQQKIREEKEKQIEEQQKELNKQTIEEFNESYSSEMKYLREWLNENNYQILFDSKYHNWKTETSIFDKQIFGKSHIAILIEDEKNNVFGCYVDKRIDRYNEFIKDKNAFIFSLKTNERIDNPTKYPILFSDESFRLGKSSDDLLFSIGEGDIVVMKENCITNEKYHSYSQSSFKYEGLEKRNENNEKHTFDVKRIFVIQINKKEKKSNMKYQREKISLEYELCVGIDLGTTYSSISYYDKEKDDIVIVEIDNKQSIPSWISLSDLENGRIIVGDEAKNDPRKECVCYDSKRLLGKYFDNIGYTQQRDWSFRVTADDLENDYSPIKVMLKNPLTNTMETFYPEEISAMILKYLKTKLEEKISNPIYKAVSICVPVSFNHLQRQATLAAAKLAGFTNVKLLNDASSVLIEYQRLLSNDSNVSKNLILIEFGSSLDISCCNIEGDSMQILATGGDNHIGRNKFNKLIFEIIKEKIIENCDFEFDLDDDFDDFEDNEQTKEPNPVKEKITNISEKIKNHLIINDSFELNVSEIIENDENENKTIIITRDEFEQKCEEESLLKQISDTLINISTRANFTKRNTNVILLGSTCQIPCIQKEIFKIFDKNKVVDSKLFDSITAHCKGACYHAMKRSENINLFHDTISQPFGLEVNGCMFQKMIDAGEPLPAKAEKIFYTIFDNQTEARFAIFSGFSPSTDSLDMTFIDKCIISNITPRPKGKTKFKVIMEINEEEKMNIRCVEVDFENETKIISESNGKLENDINKRKYGIIDLEDKLEEIRNQKINKTKKKTTSLMIKTMNTKQFYQKLKEKDDEIEKMKEAQSHYEKQHKELMSTVRQMQNDFEEMKQKQSKLQSEQQHEHKNCVEESNDLLSIIKVKENQIGKILQQNENLSSSLRLLSTKLEKLKINEEETEQQIEEKKINLENLGMLSSVIKELEQSISLKHHSILFDSFTDNWKKGTSTFESKLIGKEKILICIETTENIIIGGFLNKNINRTNKKISDSDCFIFTNKNKKLSKYPIKKENKFDAFILHTQQDPKLFTFGNDLIVYKEDNNNQSNVNERNGYFDYGTERNALLGKVGNFTVKQIYVIQFE